LDHSLFFQWFFLPVWHKQHPEFLPQKNSGMFTPKSRAEQACWQQRCVPSSHNWTRSLHNTSGLTTPRCCAPRAAWLVQAWERVPRRMKPALSKVCALCWIRQHCCCRGLSLRQGWIRGRCPVPTLLQLGWPILTFFNPPPPLPLFFTRALAHACACACACTHPCWFLCQCLCACACLCLYPCL